MIDELSVSVPESPLSSGQMLPGEWRGLVPPANRWEAELDGVEWTPGLEAWSSAKMREQDEAVFRTQRMNLEHLWCTPSRYGAGRDCAVNPLVSPDADGNPYEELY